MSVDYNRKVFRSVSNSPSGEVSGDTEFRYFQDGIVVWSEYEGGDIVKGFLIGVVAEDGSLNARYQHVNSSGLLMTGICDTKPELLHDGRLRLHETWQWTSGDRSSGVSVLEEVL
ncbi:MAG: n-acetylglutamate synthase [Acidobacteria bacterium]|nr:MAG: n-acetylglutamate synthase [Acidobacteriota bacterium]REJ99159.1 MAG: n-acetylglutamate synthase [Acidobacteriota bacterium]REK16120.1 MAG: n-acetylglutamate synthase [Acidobacteriota bacterium]REK43801.1 MAG: n-acetylglutamate synthase [Acidobacteriota bacterium]